MNVLMKLLYGHYSLPVAFWSFYVGGSIFWIVISTLMFHFVFKPLHIANLGFALGIAIGWAYLLIASVGVWNSAAANANATTARNRLWDFWARAVVLMVAARVVFGLINGGALNFVQLITSR